MNVNFMSPSHIYICNQGRPDGVSKEGQRQQRSSELRCPPTTDKWYIRVLNRCPCLRTTSTETVSTAVESSRSSGVGGAKSPEHTRQTTGFIILRSVCVIVVASRQRLTYRLYEVPLTSLARTAVDGRRRVETLSVYVSVVTSSCYVLFT